MSASSFTKLFSSITDSTIWAEDDQTRIVWVTMLSMADQFGRVHAAIPGLAHRARVSIENTEKALNKFKSPDRYSRTAEHEGRRIEEIQGGWRLLNYNLYREMRSKDDRKEQNRKAQARFRDKSKQLVSNSKQSKPPSAEAEAEAEADREIGIVQEVIDHLNKVASKRFRALGENRVLVLARLKEGFSKDDLIGVIDSRCKLWLTNPEMREFLRPATLFCAKKFASYVGSIPAPQAPTVPTGIFAAQNQGGVE